jgi:hypothetical protein
MNAKRELGLLVMLVPALALQAVTPIPLSLPRPDGKPGDPSKPVKVYILAGQSNMVGMGDIGGARPLYPSVMLSADPAIIPGMMPIGGSALAAHGVYQSADAKSERGAVVSLYEGAYDPKADYTRLTPVKTASVALAAAGASLPAIDGPHTAVAAAWIDVPVTGIYTLHPGFGQSTHAVVTLNGKDVYRKEVGGKAVCEKVSLETGKRYFIEITYFKSGSAAFWMEQVDLPAKGDLETVTKVDKQFQYLLDRDGKWTVRDDVYLQEARIAKGGRGAPLSATANNGRSIGPELGFGCVMGTFHDEQVLLIKTAMGNRSLGFDFRPPSSGRSQPADDFEGAEYRLMVQGVRETLDDIAKVVPGYRGQGYEIAGFGWFQGHKDKDAPKEEYEKHLVNLINDLRKEFNVTKMPVVVATVGFHGYRLGTGSWTWQGVWEAQMAVGDPKQHPEFAGTVASVDTRDFWREVEESPKDQDYHYNRNAETYMLVGEAMGRAMVRLEGGEAEAIPKSDREARVAAEEAAQAAKAAPTAEQKAASLAAVKPLILDGALVEFVNSPRYQPELESAIKGEKPARGTPFLNDALDEAVAYYHAAGIDDYDWKPFGGDMKNATWETFSFDLPKAQADPKAKFVPVAKVTYPARMENWFSVDFDAQKAGWKSGAAPFGESADKLKLPEFAQHRAAKRVPATPCNHDVLLLRQSFDFPPLKEGHRYRIRVGGSAHNNMGEGYAIYINGKLLVESKNGVVAWRREGGRPRGSHVWPEFRDEFKGGKVTIAVSNYPMDNRPTEAFIPPGDALSLWLEEMKLPPLRE